MTPAADIPLKEPAVSAAAGALADPFTLHAAKLGYKEIANVASMGLLLGLAALLVD